MKNAKMPQKKSVQLYSFAAQQVPMPTDPVSTGTDSITMCTTILTNTHQQAR